MPALHYTDGRNSAPSDGATALQRKLEACERNTGYLEDELARTKGMLLAAQSLCSPKANTMRQQIFGAY